MDQYIISCTEEQTKKALDLGAPIDNRWIGKDPNPTAEQMMGWIEEQGLSFSIYQPNTWSYDIHELPIKPIDFGSNYDSRKEATLAAIDAALGYLNSNKK